MWDVFNDACSVIQKGQPLIDLLKLILATYKNIMIQTKAKSYWE